MKQELPDRNRKYLTISLIYLALYILVATLYVQYQNGVDRKTLINHSKIISNDVWAMNPSGVENYLHLAMETQYYKEISVTIPGDDNFLNLKSPPLRGFVGFLNRIGFIPTKEFHEEIFYRDLGIGDIRVIQYVHLIFPLFNLLVLHLLLLLLTFFFLFTTDRRKNLEILVRDRTRNLLESQRRFHDLVNLLPEMVLETDLDGNIKYANSESRKRFGFLHEENQSSNLFDFFPAEDRKKARQRFRKSLDEGSLQQPVLKDRNHHSFPVIIRCAPIIQQGEATGARLLIIDITDRQQMEEQLNRDQKMKAIGLMAGGVAHDLNNILSGIVSYPEVLLLDLDESSPIWRPLNTIRKAGIEASEVVADLLTVARGSRGDTELVAPNTLIRTYLDSPDFEEIRSHHPLVDYSIELAPDLMSLSCSPIHVRKCLMNLVSNGFEAIEGKGRVRISTDNVEPEELEERNLPLPRDKRYIRITVSDSGTGIESKELANIFEPFYSKKVMGRSGTGLGLTVVWNTVRDHGGTIQVSSSSRGTSFELFFPGVDQKVVHVQPSVGSIPHGSGETVLVIDDEERQREIATTLLRSLGYSVSAVSTGQEAWDFLQKKPVDILVLDMLMGVDQPNGKEIYKRILTFCPEQKAIIASGFAEDDDVRETLAMGAGAFVSKPYTINSIGEAVQKTLAGQPPETTLSV